jgi:Domain of unknown function (DUF4350)
MADFKKLLRQYWQAILIGIIAIVLLTIISAMGGDPRQVGSSYSIAPNGYGAWYQMMLDRGGKIQRWQKSFAQLATIYEQRTTLLQVNSQLEELIITAEQQKWIEQGNTLAVLGVVAPAQATEFKQDITSPQGKIRIETTRRFKLDIPIFGLPSAISKQAILSDLKGSIIAQSKLGKGRIIIATTPHLAANVYQEFRPNYELLARLVTEERDRIIVDEYIHGYRDRSADAERKTGNVIGYLARTPLIIVVINLVLGLLVTIWQQNRRFGQIEIPKLPQIDNSEAYIQALGGVLHQANSSEFVVKNIGKAEQLSWQQKLGLGGERLVETQTLITAWENQTKLPADDLRFVLQLATSTRRLNQAELQLWLTKLQNIGCQLK